MASIRFSSLRSLIQRLREEKKQKFNRFVPIGDLLSDRWENAKDYGFGEGSNCYDNVIVIGDVKVGKNVWIGPNVILDGSGAGLEIGNHCSISAGVQIYNHDTVRWSTSLGKAPVNTAKIPTRIGQGVYIGPQCVLQQGINIGEMSIIGTNSFVNCDIPANVKAWGTPARIIGPATD